MKGISATLCTRLQALHEFSVIKVLYKQIVMLQMYCTHKYLAFFPFCALWFCVFQGASVTNLL